MLQKRLDYGFSGYHVPFIPKAARSARRRGSVRPKVEDNEMCAFDVLATVAGKLLLGENSEDVCLGKDRAVNVENAVNKEQHDDGDPLKLGRCDQENVEVPSLPLELSLQDQAAQCNSKEAPGREHDISLVLGSLVTSSDCLEKDDARNKMDCDEKSEVCCNSEKQDGCFPVHLGSCLPDINEFVEQCNDEETFSENGPCMHSSEDSKISTRKPPTMVASDSNVKLALCKDQHQNICGSLSSYRGNKVREFSRDDDENSSECTQPSTIATIRSRTHIGDRRIRKLLSSKYWRVGPRVKNGDLSDTESRCLYQNRKFGYKRRRSQRIYPFKKRRYFRYNLFSKSVADISGKGVRNSSEKVKDMTASGFGAVGHGVKLRIKSFRVPEFVIEMPETATVGYLKRTVMEAMTALLEGGLRIGVLLQGEKIRDDNRTLLQSGICHDDKVESLGITLEPNSSHTSLPVSSEDNSLVLSTDITEPVSRCPSSTTGHQGISHEPSYHPITNMGNLIESDHDSAPSPAEMSAEKGTADSGALVALPEGTLQALAVVPVNQKSKRTEIGQRRIRRPFSVTEVEALVQAVEKLGTGRWRDVKQQAFDNAKHRTYVDLKDKWKTLVHTATISPQQRRGEPVPQELLDRVLAAHAFWSLQQAKQHPMHQPDACSVL